MLDQGVPDEKILAYATGNPRFSSIQNYTDVQPHLLKEIEHFFSTYKDLEEKRTEVLGWKDRDAAHTMLEASHERFTQTNARAVGATWE
jgi:inorganic pyrophosphatase